MKMRKNHLREAVEKLKLYYIKQLMDAGIYTDSEDDLHSLTVTELKIMVNKFCHQKIK